MSKAFVTRELIDGVHRARPARTAAGEGRRVRRLYRSEWWQRGIGFSLAIAHMETQGRPGRSPCSITSRSAGPPGFSPEQVVEEFVRVLAAYDVTTAGRRPLRRGSWVSEAFRKYGIAYEAERAGQEPGVLGVACRCSRAGAAELLDHARLHAQLLGARTPHGAREAGIASIDGVRAAMTTWANGCRRGARERRHRTCRP